MAADGEGFDRGNPGLLDRVAAELVGRRIVGEGEPAVDLVDVAEVALEIPNERDAPVVEMSEIDAGAEDMAPLVFRMLYDGAAHDGDLARRIEQRQIDADLGAIERALILRIEEARIVLRHHRGLADAPNRRAVELDHAVALELRQQRLRVGTRQQHGVAEMPAAALAAERGREEQPLVDLEPALVALDQAILSGELLRRRNEARHYVRGADHQFLDPHEARALLRQRVINGIAMAAQKAHARGARPVLN